MPVTINGDGTITGYTPPIADGSITSAKLANGAVGTTHLAANSVTHAKTTGLQRRISTTVTLPAANSITHNITTGAKKIEILVSDVSSANNSNLHLLLGDSGGIETSGYGHAMGFHRTGTSSREATVSTSTAAFSTYGLDSSSYQIWGTWKLCNPNGNFWYAEHNMWGSLADDHTFYGNGYKELSGTMTQFKLKTNSGNFDSGVVTIVETMGDS